MLWTQQIPSQQPHKQPSPSQSGSSPTQPPFEQYWPAGHAHVRVPPQPFDWLPQGRLVQVFGVQPH
jgi:hypothetical protein